MDGKKTKQIARGTSDQSLSRYGAGRSFHGVFIHFTDTKEPQTSGHGTVMHHMKGITENSHMQTTISVVRQLKQWK